MAFSKKLTLRDSSSPTTSVDLFYINKYDPRPQNVINNTEFVLFNGIRAIDYGVDKNVWNFNISIEAGLEPQWTAQNLVDLETLYALRTTQTIELVDNWKESGTVYTVHFEFFEKFIGSQAVSDAYRLRLKQA